MFKRSAEYNECSCTTWTLIEHIHFEKCAQAPFGLSHVLKFMLEDLPWQSLSDRQGDYFHSMIFYDILNQLLSPVNIILITTRFNIIRHEICQDSLRPNIVDWVNIFNCIKMKRYVWASDEMLVMAMEVK